MNNLFVYGTLKRDQYNHYILGDSKYLGPLVLTPDQNLCMINLGAFPGVVNHTPGFYIEGELYEIDDEVLARCHRLEGHPDFYRMYHKQVNELLRYSIYILNDWPYGTEIVKGEIQRWN